MMSLCVLAHSPGTVLLLQVFFCNTIVAGDHGARTVTSLDAKETNAREWLNVEYEHWAGHPSHNDVANGLLVHNKNMLR
jgi:hypothetical protein